VGVAGAWSPPEGCFGGSGGAEEQEAIGPLGPAPFQLPQLSLPHPPAKRNQGVSVAATSSRLLSSVRGTFRRKPFSLRAETSYLSCIRRFIAPRVRPDRSPRKARPSFGTRDLSTRAAMGVSLARWLPRTSCPAGSSPVAARQPGHHPSGGVPDRPNLPTVDGPTALALGVSCPIGPPLHRTDRHPRLRRLVLPDSGLLPGTLVSWGRGIDGPWRLSFPEPWCWLWRHCRAAAC
jgi:hypothetical protein